MARLGKRPINAPPGDPRPSGVPWIGLGILTILTLIFAALVLHFLLGVGAGQNQDGPIGEVEPTELTVEAREARSGGRSDESLGFPAAATRNTTRISGSNPVDLSVAAAYAAFPVSGPGAPPAAVTLVNDGEWQAGVVAATLSASPVSAPILLAASGRTGGKTAEAIQQLNPAGAPETGEAQVITVGQVTAPPRLKNHQATGQSPAELAVAVARFRARLNGGPPESFVILNDQEPSYGGPVAAWLARSGDVALFTGKDEVPKETLEFLGRKNNSKVPVFVIGSTDVVSAEALKKLQEVAGSVQRVDGKDPVEVAVNLVRFASGTFGWNLNDPGHGYLLARADRPMDVIAATPLSVGGTWAAPLLTDSSSELPDVVRDYLLDVKPGYIDDPTRAVYNHVWIVGDPGLIDINQQARVDDVVELAPVGAAATG